MPPRQIVSNEVDPTERGRAFGESARTEVGQTVAFYERMFAESAGLSTREVAGFGGQVRGALRPHHPRLLAEIDGIAAGAAVDPDTLVAVNARTELLSAGSFSGHRTVDARSPAECSNVAVLPEATREGELLLGQTWDFHLDVFPARVLWTFPLPEGRSATTFTEAGILAKAGMNSDRVGVTIAFLATRSDRPFGGMPVHLLARLLLEESRNASDAVRLLYGSRTACSVAFTVGYTDGTDGFAVAAELSPGGMQLVYPDEHGVLVHTNHFLVAPGSEDLATGPDGWHGTLVRWDFLTRSLRRATARKELDRAELKRLFASRFNAPESVCVRARQDVAWQRRGETLATVMLELANRVVTVDDGVHGGEPVIQRLEGP
jgi:isopenicillin-N N-acyltransferase like protein